VMDIDMPNMDGIQAAIAIHALKGFENVPILSFSANAFIEQQPEAASANFCGYLTKPLRLDLLVPILKKHLNVRD
jgi:CheY-like chemotaxis protein